MRLTTTACALLGCVVSYASLAVFETSQAPAAASRQRAPGRDGSPTTIHWPEGTERLSFEDLDGMILLHATLTGTSGIDTTGELALDTGAGYLALDRRLAEGLGINLGVPREGLALAPNALPRLKLGELVVDQSPFIAFDIEGIRSVIDRPLLGLIGQLPIRDRALWIDFAAKSLALVPATSSASGSAIESSRAILEGTLSPRAVAVPFRLLADGKVLLRARIEPRKGIASPWRTFLFDTGSTKCAYFVDSEGDETADWGPALRGLIAPTLTGRSDARMIRAAGLTVAGDEEEGTRSTTSSANPVTARDVDVLLVEGDLGRDLSFSVGEPIHGLLGYSFLRRFRVVCDYPHRVLWLDACRPFHDDRPYEHSNGGIQLERRDGTVRVMSVAEPSPAARAGIRIGDEVIAIGALDAEAASLSQLGRLMEGRPGTSLSLKLRRNGREITYRLRRSRLL